MRNVNLDRDVGESGGIDFNLISSGEKQLQQPQQKESLVVMQCKTILRNLIMRVCGSLVCNLGFTETKFMTRYKILSMFVWPIC